jgi:hypothetical protein
MPVNDSAAYTLLQVPDPLSRQALQRMRKPADEKEADLKFVHYTSPYFERIRYELMRYCSGEINGLSVLISGQRGAGKTTLTKLVIQKVMQESKALIPLPLLLHGPTIIDSEAATSDPDEDSGSKRSAPLEKEKSPAAAHHGAVSLPLNRDLRCVVDRGGGSAQCKTCAARAS